MRFNWRETLGPALIGAVAALIVVIDRHAQVLPNPGAIILCAVALATFFCGMRSGLAGAVLAVVFAAWYFSRPGDLFGFEPDNFTRFAVVAIAAPAIAVMIGQLSMELGRSMTRERGQTAQVSTLCAALDRVEYGVVLLDSELRAQFINRAFRRIWRLPDAKADSKPAFVALMYHGRDTRAYAVAESELDRYVADRVALVRSGDETPIDIRLSDGEVVRFQCIALPEGGRMISYVPITDLFSHAEAMQTLARVDGLTGIYTRRHFMALAEAEWSRFQRYHRPLSLLAIDVDHFKSINDVFGHDAGDSVLSDLARVCQEGKRSADIVGRIGGEEFAMLLPETDLAAACLVAERLRAKIELRSLVIATEPASITISIGVATATPSMSSFARLMKAADNALYEAKNSGRNRIVTAGDLPHELPLAAAE